MDELIREEIKELDKIWSEIDKGKGISMGEKEFLKEITNGG